MEHYLNRLYLSTIDSAAAHLAREYSTGIELCHFCYAPHMDTLRATQEQDLAECLKSADRFVLHAPFAELHPSAIDPLILEIAKKRFRQAAALAMEYGVKRMVVHSGYVPNAYYKSWFIERSVEFWREFLTELPNDFELLYENVMDDEPHTLKQIAEGVADVRFGFCLDVGHLNVLSEEPAQAWIETYGKLLKHVHLHNNSGSHDDHAALFDGNLDICAIMRAVSEHSPTATFTLELMDARPSLIWLKEKGMI